MRKAAVCGGLVELVLGNKSPLPQPSELTSRRAWGPAGPLFVRRMISTLVYDVSTNLNALHFALFFNILRNMTVFGTVWTFCRR
jgi:hypothetical protein